MEHVHVEPEHAGVVLVHDPSIREVLDLGDRGRVMRDVMMDMAMLGTQDIGQFEAWTKEWRDSLINCVQAAGQRNDSDPEFVESFWGDD